MTTNLAHYRLIDGEKSISLDNLQRWELLGNVPWRDEPGSSQRYYAAVPTVYRATDIRANGISSLPWAIVRGETDLWTSDEPAPPAGLAMLAELPTWLWRIEAALCLTSTAYFYRLRNRVRTLELRWMDPTSITPIIDPRDGITGWQRNTLGRDIPMQLALDDVVSIWLWGLGELSPRPAPAQAALAAAGASYNLQQFVAGYFRRGAIKATLLTVEGAPAQPERDRLKAWWDRVVGGMRNAFGAEVVSASVKPVVIGEGIKDLSNTELTNSQREDIAIAFGVPHSMLFANAANYATAEQDNLNFYNTTIVPEARLIASQLNKYLFRPLGLSFEFRQNELSLYQEDEGNRSTSLMHLVQAGLPLPLAMETLGYDLPGGMTYEQLEAQLAHGREAMQAQMQPQQSQEDGTDGDNAEDDEERRAEVRRFRTWAKRRKNPDPAQFESALLSETDKRAILAEAATAQPPFGTTTPNTKALLLQLDPDDDEAEAAARGPVDERAADELVSVLGDVLREVIPDNPADAAQMADRIDQELRHGQRVRDVLERMLLTSVDLGVSVAMRQFEGVGLGFDWTLANIAARDWAAQHAGILITQIADTTRAGVRQAVVRWIESGEPLDALVRDLETFFGRERAKLIAITEVTRAYALACAIAYRESGVVAQMEWRTARGERVCPVCGPLHGQRVALGDTWDGLTPPAHPRCRCWVAPVVGP